MAWMQICDPSDKEKGHYSIEISDGVTTHTRTFDLSGQGNSEPLSLLASTHMHVFAFMCAQFDKLQFNHNIVINCWRQNITQMEFCMLMCKSWK